MGSSHESQISAVDLMRFGRPYWLPPYGYGNGLDALFWACLAELPQTLVPMVLEALRDQDIPGWAAPVKVPEQLRWAGDGRAPYRLWVATIWFGGAEEVLMRVLHEHPQPTDAQPAPARRHRRIPGT
jgi:hypothetical protein